MRPVLAMLLFFLLTGCGAPLPLTNAPSQYVDGAGADGIPRWTCPTNTPLPYGDAGPVKDTHVVATANPTTGTGAETSNEYYAIWEQEYGSLGGPPFPPPTVYTKSTPPFFLGQLVNLSSNLDVTATAQATNTISGTDRLYIVQFDWRGSPSQFSVMRQVALTTIRTPDGRKRLGPWGWSVAAAHVAGMDDTGIMQTTAVPPTMRVPILAPDGEPDTVELRLDVGSDPSGQGGMRVQWTRGEERHCDHPGTAGAVYNGTPRPVVGAPAPAGADSLVGWVYQQIGRPYCWGGKGNAACGGNPSISYADSCPDHQGLPCWDCSGLTWGAYNARGVIIGQGTANQQNLPLVWDAGSSTDPASVAAPGDLLLFTELNSNNRPAGSITHVGMYVGNGTMVHAANYPDGVIATPNVFHSHYYGSRLARIVRPNRG